MYPPVSSRPQDPRLRKMRQFGGPLLKKSNAKTARPVSTKHVMHLVLRSSLARDAWSFSYSKNRKMILATVGKRARSCGVRLMELVNGGDSLHLMVRIRSRKSFNMFVRALSGELAMRITGSCKGQELKRQFWDYRPWTRILDSVRNVSWLKNTYILDHLKKLKLIGAERLFRQDVIHSGP